MYKRNPHVYDSKKNHFFVNILGIMQLSKSAHRGVRWAWLSLDSFNYYYLHHIHIILAVTPSKSYRILEIEHKNNI